MLGEDVGASVGLYEGDSVGFFDGLNDGDAVVGKSVGFVEGMTVGVAVTGAVVGCRLVKNEMLVLCELEVSVYFCFKLTPGVGSMVGIGVGCEQKQ